MLSHAATAAPRRRHLLACGINLGAAALGVAAWDVWRRAFPPAPPETRFEGTITEGFYRRVDDVGYLPRPDRQFTARRVTDGKTVYDVVYTIDGHGFRIVPPAVARPAASVLLLGDSNTFGEGVNDGETYAWRLAEAGQGRIEVHNFGIPGWGPHHMLAGLQSGRFEATLARPPTHAVYFFIDDQIKRAAGFAPWDRHGPRYWLDGQGRAIRDGNFDSDLDEPLPVEPPPDYGLLGWRRIAGYRPLDPPDQTALTSTLIIQSARLLETLGPGMRLHVLYWTYEDDSNLDHIAGRLRRAGVVVHSVEDVIPSYRRRWRDYLLSPTDWHPTAATHRLIGAYIARHIVRAGL